MASTLEEKERLREAKKKIRRQLRKQARREEELDKAIVAGKPIEDWDPEELARGRPRDKNGHFAGRSPQWITREIHEKAIRMFQDHTQKEIRSLVPTALETLQWILDSDEADKRGRPLVPASTKLAAAQLVVEHVIGKPRQPVDMDISVKLTAILANVMVQPGQEGAKSLVPTIDPDFVDAEVVEDEEGPDAD